MIEDPVPALVAVGLGTIAYMIWLVGKAVLHGYKAYRAWLDRRCGECYRMARYRKG